MEGEIEDAAVAIHAVLSNPDPGRIPEGQLWIEWMEAKQLDMPELAGVLDDIVATFPERWSEEERLRVGILYGIALGMAIVERRGP